MENPLLMIRVLKKLQLITQIHDDRITTLHSYLHEKDRVYLLYDMYIIRNVLLIVLWVNGVIGQHVLKPALTLSKAWTVFPRKFGQEKLYRNQMD